MPNFIPLIFFCLLRMNTWKVSIKTHSIENRFVTGPSDILFSSVHVCTFEPDKITGWGSEGVNVWLLLLYAHVFVCVSEEERDHELAWFGWSTLSKYLCLQTLFSVNRFLLLHMLFDWHIIRIKILPHSQSKITLPSWFWIKSCWLLFISTWTCCRSVLRMDIIFVVSVQLKLKWCLKGSKECYLTGQKNNLQIFRVVPFVKLRNNT